MQALPLPPDKHPSYREFVSGELCGLNIAKTMLTAMQAAAEDTIDLLDELIAETRKLEGEQDDDGQPEFDFD